MNSLQADLEKAREEVKRLREKLADTITLSAFKGRDGNAVVMVHYPNGRASLQKVNSIITHRDAILKAITPEAIKTALASI